MTSIVSYQKLWDTDDLDNPTHHFYLDLSDYDDQCEVITWINHVVKGRRQYWPVTVPHPELGWSQAVIHFQVILREDRHAALFMLRW